MIKRINGRFFAVGSLYLKGGDVIENCLVCFADNFVIVAKDPTEIKNTWYNTDQVQRMEGVEAERESRQSLWTI